MTETPETPVYEVTYENTTAVVADLSRSIAVLMGMTIEEAVDVTAWSMVQSAVHARDGVGNWEPGRAEEAIARGPIAADIQDPEATHPSVGNVRQHTLDLANGVHTEDS